MNDLHGPMELPRPGWLPLMNPYWHTRPQAEGLRPVPHDGPTHMRAAYGERRLEVIYYDEAYMVVVDGRLLTREDSRRVAQARIEDHLALPDGKHLAWEEEA